MSAYCTDNEDANHVATVVFCISWILPLHRFPADHLDNWWSLYIDFYNASENKKGHFSSRDLIYIPDEPCYIQDGHARTKSFKTSV